MLGENFIWNIAKECIEKQSLVHHQITTFDNFINEGIERVVSENDIKIKNKEFECSYSFDEVYIPKPILIKEDRSVSKMYPSNARVSDLTYDSPIFVNITEKFKAENEEPEVIVHKRVIIGRTPIMLRSETCNLSNLTRKERQEIGECEKDQGGYFIIRGKERVLIGQIRNAYNNPIVLSQKSGDKYKHICEIRSMSEETGHSVLIQCKVGQDDRTFVFSLPYIKEVIPVGVVFKALGVIDEKLFREVIGIVEGENEDMERYLKYIIRDSFFVKSQEDALKFISQFTIHIIKEDKKIAYTTQVVENELFPHMGIFATIKEKTIFLGRMVNRLIRTTIGIRKDDDRDNYSNKRVEMAGVLCCDLFRTLFKRFIKTIELQLEKKKQRPDILSITSRCNSITTGLKSCFSTGAWGIAKNNYVRSGVSQVLSRLTFGATLSHLRRLIIPIGREGKNAKIRQIHSSQIMYICPTETPEGQSIGVVLNLALTTTVTTRVSTVVVKEIIENCDHLILINNESYNFAKTKVFLNGILMGFTNSKDSLIGELYKYREIGLLDRQISFTYDKVDNEILIFCDEGRLIRPLLNVNSENRLMVKEGDQIDWDYLISNRMVCYVDNSEIQNYVIAMNENDLLTQKCDLCEITPALMLGVMASSIPFPDHNQSPRNIYQASMGKQAIGIYALSHQIRTDTITHVLDYPQKPLVSTIPSRIMGFDDMPSGINAIVAVITYSGFNQEDSLIMNKSSIERGLFVATSYRTLVDEERKQGTYNYEKICLPPISTRKKNVNYSFLDERGLVCSKINNHSVYVEKGDVIIGKLLTKSNKNNDDEQIDCSYVIKSGEEGFVDRVIETINPNGYKIVKVVIRNQRIPEQGDKFASRSAQKGTIGLVMSQEDMPFTASGITPDILINSLCIPSRMTISQLIECVLGKVCCEQGTFGDATPFSSNSTDIADLVCDRLQATGFQKHGYETMYNGMTGEPLEAKIFVGPTFYQRLKHMVTDKLHSRSHGQVTTLTRQPLEGRSRDGGLRFGEMERDAMIGHGVSRFLKERLFDKSDGYQIYICDICGLIATSKVECKSCNNDKISKCNLPFASKLLFQELMAMSIKVSLKVQSIQV
jgi:DNA-directed RNA polymerase II subunit RPB2